MAKIPKNLSDKDMFKDYKEAPTLEADFLRADEARAEKKRRAKEETEREMGALSLSPETLDSLEKMLLELKLELYREGTVDYRLVLRREGKNIVLAPVTKEK